MGLDGPNVITRVLTRGRQESPRRRRDLRSRGQSDDGRRLRAQEHGSLQKPARQGTTFSLEPAEGTTPADTLVLA